jgi:hypothetical protein
MYGRGLGWTDVHLLASALLTPAGLWTSRSFSRARRCHLGGERSIRSSAVASRCSRSRKTPPWPASPPPAVSGGAKAPDVMIAGVALEHRLRVLTADADFARLIGDAAEVLRES